MVEDCPLCMIPIQKEEPLLYEDKDIYLVSTKKMKGHDVRVMVCLKEHLRTPSFHSKTKAHYILVNYMYKIMRNEPWFVVDCQTKHSSYPDHWHLIGCDSKGTKIELELLQKTPKVKFPLCPSKKVLIGIPAYNEEKTISSVVKEAKKFGYVMVVDDGSTDDTSNVALQAGAGVTENDENYGYGYSLRKIFREAKNEDYDILITLDADGQHNPNEIPTFLQAINNGADVVVGNRFLRETDTPFGRKFVVKMISKVEGVGDAQCGFRGYSKKAIQTINLKSNNMGASLEILHQAKKKGLWVVSVPCSVTSYDSTHSVKPIKQGLTLVERILWHYVWERPFNLSKLGISALIVGCIGVLQTFSLYVQFREFVLSWAIFGLSGILSGLILVTVSILLYFMKKVLEEVK